MLSIDKYNNLIAARKETIETLREWTPEKLTTSDIQRMIHFVQLANKKLISSKKNIKTEEE